jgi:hypothetical protein
MFKHHWPVMLRADSAQHPVFAVFQTKTFSIYEEKT